MYSKYELCLVQSLSFYKAEGKKIEDTSDIYRVGRIKSDIDVLTFTG